MYETYTRQALPSKEYRELLGTALCVFNSNNAFIIECVLKVDEEFRYNWFNLIDLESGYLIHNGKKFPMRETVKKKSDGTFELLLAKIVKSRNLIINSFQITDTDGEQKLATRNKETNRSLVITEEYLMDFIKKNESLSTMIYEFRGH